MFLQPPRNRVKAFLKSALNSVGYDLSRTDKVGVNPWADMRRFVRKDSPVIFDVGAYIGRTVSKFHEEFPNSLIYCFEPSPSTFAKLAENLAIKPPARMFNCGLGSKNAHLNFFENHEASLNSFLPAGRDAEAKSEHETVVEVRTLESVCRAEHVHSIDILKCDTEGYDLEVLRGAGLMLTSGAIKLVYVELNFAEIHDGQASVGQVYDYLVNAGYRLVTFYKTFRLGELAAWTDALFVHVQ